MKKKNLNDVSIVFAIIAMIIAVSNLFGASIPRDIIYALYIVSLICNWAHAMRQYKKYSDLYLLKSREVLDLKWSYQEMGRYIDRLKVPELNDLDLRIKNELNDIKVKKEWYAKNLGIKDGIEQ